MFELIKTGGWLMAPIMACSLVAATIIFERLLALRRARVLPERLVAILRRWSEQGAITAADVQSLALDSPLGRIVAMGLASRDRGREVLRERVEDTGRHVAHELERFLNTLGTIAAISPLLGLLGTVSGMIKAFGTMGREGMGDPSRLAANSSEALITTAVGLIIAIPAIMAYFIFRNRLANLVNRCREAAEDMLNDLIVAATSNQ